MIDIILVAVFARGHGMFPLQFEGREVVIKFGRRPTFGGVTRSTVRAEAARVCILLNMAGRTIRARCLHVCDTARIQVAFITGYLNMIARQLKTKTIMVEIVPVGVNAIVTGETVPAPTEDVRGRESHVNLTMTIRTDRLIKTGDIVTVTITTDKRLTRDLELVTV